MTNLSNLFEWLKISNRPKHLKAGIIIFIIWIGSVLLLTTMTILQAALTGAICVFVAMCAVEYNSKKHWWEMGLAGHFGRNTPSYNCSFDYLPIWSF